MFESVGVVERVGGGPSPAVIRAVEALDERFERLLRAWWCDERPDWTEPAWWDTVLRDDVRRLLWLPPGPLLVAALAEATTPDSLAGSASPGGAPGDPLSSSAPWVPWVPCPDPHVEGRSADWPALGHAPGWPCACQVVLAAAWEACAAWVAAGAAAALVRAAGPSLVEFDPGRPAPRVQDPAREELGAALRVSPNSMGNRIAAARDLVTHPGLHALVVSGGISAWGARVVVLELVGLPADLAAAVVAEVVARVRTRLGSGRRPWTSAEIGRTTRALRSRLAPEHEHGARQQAWADRKVQVFGDRNGMATLHAVLDATDAHRIHRRLSAIAAGLADADRTRDQVRADILVDVLLAQTRDPQTRDPQTRDPQTNPGGVSTPATGVGPATSGVGGSESGPAGVADEPAGGVGGGPAGRPEINVVVSLATVLGLSEDPAHVPGIGLITADVARDLAADGTWRAWVTDAVTAATGTGHVIATGTRAYTPTAALARLVRAREPHCRMPGCRTTATRCDLDHTIAWPRGGTTATNLGPLCRRHHILKTHAGWQLEPGHDTAKGDEDCTETQPPNWTWRTPAGFTIRDQAQPALE